jgi:nicotinic acid mononucleotide adenylyltransferase
MDRTGIQVPFGYEPPEETSKGTLLIYDSFDLGDEEDSPPPVAGDWLDRQGLAELAGWAERRFISRVVWYVPHEETLKRMGVRFPAPMYKREEALREAADSIRSGVRTEIDIWERKRKKYTPMDTALRYMEERYNGPYFLGLSEGTANRFASYQGFEEWVRKIRLVVAAGPEFQPHPLLGKHASRWNAATKRE